ncbi:hypothetical protein GW17_00039692, partial [Ensete ventricosum]
VMEDYTSSNGHRFKRIPRQMFAANPELEPLVLHVKLLDLLVCIFKPILELSIQVNWLAIKFCNLDLYRPIRAVHIGPLGYWYADRPLLGGTAKIDRRRSIEGEKGKKKKKRKIRKKKRRRRPPFPAPSLPVRRRCPRVARASSLPAGDFSPARGDGTGIPWTLGSYYGVIFMVNASLIRRAVFSLDAPSASVCLLIQLEKPATEEGGVTASVYSRKEPVSQGSLSCLNGVVSPVHRAYCQVYWARHAFQAFDFRMMTRNEPFSQLFHYLYVYPLTVSLSRKRNLFIKVEMRKDDADIRKQPLEVCLDEADFVTIGYAVLPLSTHIQ